MAGLPRLPPSITRNSSNPETRKFLAVYLQHIDADITPQKAWELVSSVFGTGDDALEMSRKEWQELFGEIHGKLVYNELFSHQYADKDTIWPHFRHFYRALLLLIGISSGITFWKTGTFHIDQRWNIAAFIYFVCYGSAYIFVSAKSIDRNPQWPEYIKIRPMGETQKNWRWTLGYADEPESTSTCVSPGL